MARKVLFLDRDGVLNIDRGYINRIQDWQFCEGAIAGIRALRAADFRIALVTNQSGVARGMFSIDELRRLHHFVQQQLREAGAPLDAIAFCPHAPQANCLCRKPRIDTAHQIEQTLGELINYSESWMIGDKLSDMKFGKRLGARTVLIESRYWQWDEVTNLPNVTARSLWEAVPQILDSQAIAGSTFLADETRSPTCTRQVGSGRCAGATFLADETRSPTCTRQVGSG